MTSALARPDAVQRILLRVPNRRRVFEAVVALPGTHVRRLSRELGMALGVVEHHVRQLVKHGLLFTHQMGRRKTLYVQGQVAPEDVAVIHALRKPAWGRLLDALIEGRECGVAQLAARLGEPAAATSYHVRRLKELGLLHHVQVGRESVYVVGDPERVSRLLRELRADPRSSKPDATFVGLVERASVSPVRARKGPAARSPPRRARAEDEATPIAPMVREGST